MRILFNILLNFVLVATFYFFITPISLFFKMMRFDLINIRIDKSRKSYWIRRKSIIKKKKFFSQWVLK